MALLGPHQLEPFLPTKQQLGHFSTTSSGSRFSRPTTTNILNTPRHNPFPVHQSIRTFRCSAIAIDAPSTLTDVAGVRWGFTSLQGAREEMEDDIVIRSDGGHDGFSFAAVLDGHGGFNSVHFLRDELYKECLAALQGGSLLNGKDYNAIKEALESAFVNVDSKLLTWLEMNHAEDESGSTATVVFIASDRLIISHIGDSNVVLSRSGKAEVLTDPHRPYGSNKSSLQEIRRIREAGGWINNGRICGDIAVSRAFGDMRFKTKKTEMLQKGVEEGRWTEKFTSRSLSEKEECNSMETWLLHLQIFIK
ncbi:Protein phosphatase 2C 57 [Linum perenne]